MITKEQIENLAGLCMLKFNDEELNEFTKEFSSLMEFIEKINDVDTENVEPLYQVYDYKQVFREDVVKEGLSRDEVLQNTVEKQYGYFKLFNIME